MESVSISLQQSPPSPCPSTVNVAEAKEPEPASISEMSATEVIILSDDDDDVVPLPSSSSSASVMANRPVLKTYRNSNQQQAENKQATAHVGNVTKLNLEQLGIRRLADAYQRNLLNKSAEQREIARIQHHRAQLAAAASMTYHQMAIQNVNRRYRPPLYEPGPTTATPSTSRTRNNRVNENGTGPKIYKGHYMFEAMETYEPARRFTRSNVKKMDGKFVCSYNPAKCYKLCNSPVDIINHVWAHLINDPPPIPMPEEQQLQKPVRKPRRRIYINGSEAILSDNCQEALRKLQTCFQCNAVFNTVYAKQEHVIACHLEQDRIETVCNICEKDLKNGINLENHMKKHLPGEAPYHCRKCKYRTSIKIFYFQHYIEKHSHETLACPLCLYQEDLRPSTRKSKHIFIRNFIEHMRLHSTATQYRCTACALCFNDVNELTEHRANDHVHLNTLWQVQERREIHKSFPTMLTKKVKITMLQKLYLENTLEGKRVNDEVACKGGLDERLGYDTSTGGNTFFECDCGFNSYNGNRAASHFHRCRKAMTDIEQKRERHPTRHDSKEELVLFAVYPPRTGTEIETQEEYEKQIYADQPDPYKVQSEEVEFQKIDNLLMLKMMATEKDGSADIIAECVSNMVESDE